MEILKLKVEFTTQKRVGIECKREKNSNSHKYIPAAMLYSALKAWQSANIKAVLPLPTGPPIPIVNALSFQSRVRGFSLSVKVPNVRI